MTSVERMMSANGPGQPACIRTARGTVGICPCRNLKWEQALHSQQNILLCEPFSTIFSANTPESVWSPCSERG